MKDIPEADVRMAAAVLAKIAALSSRPAFGKAAVLAWAEVLHDIPEEHALLAVAQHFETSAEFIMPAHIRRIVEDREFRNARLIECHGAPDYPDMLTDYQREVYRTVFLWRLDRGESWAVATERADGDVTSTMTGEERTRVAAEVAAYRAQHRTVTPARPLRAVQS